MGCLFTPTGVVVTEGYSFNYNLVDDDEQAQKPDESFSDYQIRLLGLVTKTLDAGNIRTYYKGIHGDDAKDDTRPKGHVFTIVPKLGADGQPTDGPSCSAAAGDVCRTIFTPNGVCGGDGTSCGASLLAEAYRTCPMACQECQYEGGGNGATVSRHDIAGIWVAFFSRCHDIVAHRVLA